MITSEQRKKLVENFIPYADKQAWKKYRNTPKCVTIDELKSAAYLGLCDAASKAESIDDFNPFIRIYGEMKDYLRSLDWGVRNRPALATNMEFDVEAHSNPDDGAEDIIFKIDRVVGRDVRDILVMHYVNDEKCVEIAARIGKTKGRVSQILKQAREELQGSPLLRAA